MDSENSSHGCLRCGGKLHREHRRWWQRLVYRSVYSCDDCGATEARRRRFVRLYFSLHARCPRCWSYQLQVFSKRDRIEGFQNSILRRIQGWLGAPLYYCERCRLQFYDARPYRRPDSPNPNRAAEDGHPNITSPTA